MKGVKTSSNQVFDVAEEAREGARALSESVRERLDQSLLRANIDSMAGSCQLHHRQTGRDALSFVNNQTNTNKPPPTRRTH
jgi:hypothetical protein